MNPTTLSRATRKVRSAPAIFSRASSSQAQPTKKSSFKDDSRALPVSALRSLVTLHHAAAGFLHSPRELPIGFENAFRRTRPPHFRTYQDFNRQVQAARATHLPGGMENLVARKDENSMTMGSSKSVYSSVQRAFKPQNVSYFQDMAGAGPSQEDRKLSERQMRVREAVYGVWERGGRGMTRAAPGLDGVLEYLAAKGKSVKDYSNEWEKRGEEVQTQGKTSVTEDGM